MADVLDKSVSTPVGDAPVVPVALMVTGLYLCWFGVHYWRSDTKWPSDPIKAVLTGKPIPVPDRSAQQAALDKISGAAKQQAGGGEAAVTPTGGAEVIGGQGPAQGPGLYVSNAARRALWIANGGSPTTAGIAAAISQAEDGSGDPGVTSANPDGGRNVGLWQLDTKGVGAGYTVSQLSDPNTNARITVMATANGTNWSAWETWHTGVYKQYL